MKHFIIEMPAINAPSKERNDSVPLLRPDGNGHLPWQAPQRPQSPFAIANPPFNGSDWPRAGDDDKARKR